MIQFEVNGHGAELRSLKRDGREYLWQGDPAFWGRRSPILFPVVGTLADDVLRIGGREFRMSRHGFARDASFVPAPADDPATRRFVMEGDGRRDNYPYEYGFEADYTPAGDTLSCKWKVTNRSAGEMHFQIGAHPAFNLPDYDPADPVHGYFRCLDASGNAVSPIITNYVSHDGLRRSYPSPRRPFGANGLVPITSRSFDDDAILLEGGQVASVALLDKAGREVLRVDCPCAQAYGLWAPDKPGCPFVCIEPWCGIADRHGFSGDISERELDHALAPGGSFEFEYLITIQ